jgi:hypothetical protein
MRRVTIAHNTITGVEQAGGRLYQVNGAIEGLTIVNNSGVGGGQDVYFVTEDKPIPTFVFRDNVTGGFYTLFSSIGFGPTAMAALQIPAANVAGNVFANGQTASRVPSGNLYAATTSVVGFVDYAGGDLRLAPGSPFRTSGTNGSLPGADVAAVNAMTHGVVR